MNDRPKPLGKDVVPFGTSLEAWTWAVKLTAQVIGAGVEGFGWRIAFAEEGIVNDRQVPAVGRERSASLGSVRGGDLGGEVHFTGGCPARCQLLELGLDLRYSLPACVSDVAAHS